MRKIYWRRCFLLAFFLCLISTFVLVFITALQSKRENIVSVIYNSRADCLEAEKNSPGQSNTIPPHYLVVPYREFVLRTSISCRAFKLDNPKENPSNFHARYSKYLRGAFPFVVPYANITFLDVDNFYNKILPTKSNETIGIQTSFAPEIKFEYIPYRYRDHMWSPVQVRSAQRTAILVPLQGRDYNAKAFLLNMHAFARRQQLTYTIVLAEQVSPLGHRFNKGRLFNTAINYLQKQSLNITCLILHDVDLLPENDGNLYTCESTYPKHTTSRVRQIGSTRGYNRYYEFLIGGVLMLTFDMYKNLNGFSNLFWGWGGEDDDLSLRLIQRRMCIVRPNYDIAVYSALPHPRGQRNNARFGLLTWSTIRLDSDGYSQIEPLTHIISIHQTSMVVHLKVDADAGESLYKPPSFSKLPSPVDGIAAKITTSSKTVSTTTETTTTTTTTVTTTVSVTTTTTSAINSTSSTSTTTTKLEKNP